MPRPYQPSIPRLSSAGINRYFQRETFHLAAATAAPQLQFLATLTTEYFVNIGAQLWSFLPSDPETFHQVVHWLGYSRYPTTTTLRRFLQVIPELSAALVIDPAATAFSSSRFREINPFTWDGELAEVLYTGGAYRAEENPARAKALPQAFSASLLRDAYPQWIIYYTAAALGGWYGDIGRDHTFLLFDQEKRQGAVLAIADVD